LPFKLSWSFNTFSWEKFLVPGVNPIDWTAKRRNLEYRSSEFLGLILYSDSLRLAVFLAKEVLGRSSD
jgi:hypothetical protein